MPWRRDRLPTLVFLVFHGGFPDSGKESACNAGDLGSIPGLGRSPGEGKCYPLQYYGLENSMDWIVHGVTKSQTWLSDFHFTSLQGILTPSSVQELRGSKWERCNLQLQRLQICNFSTTRQGKRNEFHTTFLDPGKCAVYHHGLHSTSPCLLQLGLWGNASYL